MDAASELEAEASSPKSPPASQLDGWIRTQDLLKQRLITRDDFSWKLPTVERLRAGEEEEGEALRYVGGLDISFCKDSSSSVGCATLVVLDFRTLRVVSEESAIVHLDVPYVSGFLAFREAPVLLTLLETMKKKDKDTFPQLIMVDGNGVLHPRGFGLACHLGVLADIPSIGIGKNLHFVDGLTMPGVKQLLKSQENFSKDAINLIGSSGCTWGVALKSAQDASKPIFVSIGHRISLDTAVRIVRSTCIYKNPEPVRQADIQSRAFLRSNGYHGRSHLLTVPFCEWAWNL